MTDETKQFGTVNLVYEDLVTYPKTLIPESWFYSNWGRYVNTGISAPYIIRQGRTVQLFGAVTPKQVSAGDLNGTPIMILPTQFRPAGRVSDIKIGSGFRIFSLTIDDDGTVTASRHMSGVDQNLPFNPGQFVTISSTFVTLN